MRSAPTDTEKHPLRRTLLALGIIVFFMVFCLAGLGKLSLPLPMPQTASAEPYGANQKPDALGKTTTPSVISEPAPETIPESIPTNDPEPAPEIIPETVPEIAPADSPPALPQPLAPEQEDTAASPPGQPDASPGESPGESLGAEPEKSEQQNDVPKPGEPEKAETQPSPAGADAFSWPPLIARLAADGFDATEMEKLFASLGSPPLPEFMAQKAIELYGRYGKASLNIADENRARFAPPDHTRIADGMTVAAGRKLMQTNRAFFEGLYKRFGVPAPFIIAILMVETGLGSELGSQSALLALGSMAVADDLAFVLPVIKGLNSHQEAIQELIKARSDWAYAELKALIEYAKTVGKDAATIPGSVYGAIGICQFMPSNIPLYGVSSSKSRPVPDLFILSDAAASVARYLAAHGWKNARTPLAQVGVLRSYNHSDIYASTVYGVAMALMSPTTHLGATAAQKGGNAVRAARETARAIIPSGKKKGEPIKALPNYSDLLK